jgi:hypothetical protein
LSSLPILVYLLYFASNSLSSRWLSGVAGG